MPRRDGDSVVDVATISVLADIPIAEGVARVRQLHEPQSVRARRLWVPDRDADLISTVDARPTSSLTRSANLKPHEAAFSETATCMGCTGRAGRC
jgi:hypothetical protein